MFLRRFIFLIVVFLIFAPFVSGAQAVLTGSVQDGESGAPLEFANVTLMNPGDSSSVTGESTGSDGRFRLEASPGDYLIRITYIGFDTYWNTVELEVGEMNFGAVVLSDHGQDLDEYVVEALRPTFRSEIDRRIFNLEDVSVADGGNALDILETLPSIQVDDEGNISMRGSGQVMIYINGRPTNMITDDAESVLEQFPADQIKEVELITNPSARYDAEGVGGIINIILREESRGGFNSRFNLSAGTGHKYDGGISLGYREGPWQFSGSYSYNYRQRWGNSETFRTSKLQTTSPFLDHNYNTIGYRQGHLARTGVDYEITENQYIGISGSMNYRSRDRERTYNIRNLNAEQGLDSMLIRDLEEDQSSINYETRINYGWEIDGEDRKLDASASYSYDNQDRIEYFDQRFYDSNEEELPLNRALQTYERPISSDMFISELNYQHPISERFRFESGLKSTISRERRGQIFHEYNHATGDYEMDNLVTNRFNYDEDVYGAYMILRDNWGRFSYQGGLRGEYTRTSGDQPDVDSASRHDYNYFDLFPSIFLAYEIGDNHDIQVNYSRRVNRPGMRSLQPFVNAQDFYNLRYGNPYLEPEYTNSYEVSYLRGWQNYFLSATTYHRYTRNLITRTYKHFDFDDRSATRTWINANERSNTGVEIINEFQYSRYLDMSLTTDVFHSRIYAEHTEGEEVIEDDRYSWSLSMLSNVRIPDFVNIQIQGRYRGPILIPQGMILPSWGLNLSLRRNFMDDNATVSLNLRDVFNTRKFEIESRSSNFDQTRFFERESRILTLSLVYRFNETDRDRRVQPSERAPDEGDIED